MRTLLSILAAAIAAHAPCQDPAEDLPAQLAQAVARLEGLDKEADKAWHDAVTHRISLLERLIATGKDAEGLPETDDLEERKSKAEGDLEAERGRKVPTSIGLTTPEQLSDYTDKARLVTEAQAKADAELTELENKRSQGDEERKGIAQKLSDARARAEKIATDDDRGRYLAENAQLEVRWITERTAYLTEAGKTWSELIPVVQVETDLARLRATLADKELEVARNEAAVLREAEAQRQREKSDAQLRAAELARDPIERFRRSSSAAVSKIKAEISAAESRIEDIVASIASQTSGKARLGREEERLEKRLALSGSADALLTRTLEHNERVQEVMTRTLWPELERGVAHSEDLLADVLDRLWEIRLPEEENRELADLLAEVPPDRHDAAVSAFEEAVHGKDGLLQLLRELRTKLEDEETKYGELSVLLTDNEKALRGFTNYARARLMWTRSEEPVSTELVGNAARELPRVATTFFDAQSWRVVTDQDRNRTIFLVGSLVVLLLGLVSTLRFRRSRKPLVADPERTGSARFAALRTFAWWALPSAGLLLVAQGLSGGGLPPLFDPAAVVGLRATAWIVLTRRVLIVFLRPGGWAVERAGMSPEVAAQILRSARLATASALCTVVPYFVLVAAPFELEALPRVLDVVWAFLCGTAIVLLLTRNGALMQKWARPGTVARPVLRLLRPIVILTLVVAIVLGCLGYNAIGDHLLLGLGKTIVALLGLGMLYQVTNRLIGRIASGVRSRVIREEGLEAAAESSTAVQRLLTNLASLLVIAAAAVLLHEFWGIGEVIYGLLSDVQFEYAPTEFLSLWDVFVALVCVVGGHVVAHNLGRMFEFVVEPLLGSGSKGTRFAFLTLSRYLVLVVAYAAALLVLRVELSTLGWMATAVSVGLGFGLQEIVANFISGLILLFERPIRVGDIITVGQTGGTVEKITIRATVVTNWERQTIIIPNKNFITQNLTNWTRNDQIMRRTLELRVAYGSDLEQVVRVLDDLLREHPSVLSDPPHRIWVKAMGENGIELEVWLFATIDNGLRARTELYGQVYEAFQREGIEIPLPRRDVRVTAEESGEMPRQLLVQPRPRSEPRSAVEG